jgi:hypothetical protein
MSFQNRNALAPYGPRDPLWRAWRMAAIYRCCIRFAKDEAWALEKVREIHPDGSRDALVGVWFMGMADLQAGWRRDHPRVEAQNFALAA